MVKNRELKDILIIDNLVTSFGFQVDNGIPIVEFTGQQEDIELAKLIPFLKQISHVEDVRPFIKKKFQIEELLNYRV